MDGEWGGVGREVRLSACLPLAVAASSSFQNRGSDPHHPTPLCLLEGSLGGCCVQN